MIFLLLFVKQPYDSFLYCKLKVVIYIYYLVIIDNNQ